MWVPYIIIRQTKSTFIKDSQFKSAQKLYIALHDRHHNVCSPSNCDFRRFSSSLPWTGIGTQAPPAPVHARLVYTTHASVHARTVYKQLINKQTYVTAHNYYSFCCSLLSKTEGLFVAVA